MVMNITNEELISVTLVIGNDYGDDVLILKVRQEGELAQCTLAIDTVLKGVGDLLDGDTLTGT